MSDKIILVPICVGGVLSYLTDCPLFIIMGCSLCGSKNSIPNNSNTISRSDFIFNTSTLLLGSALIYVVSKKIVNCTVKLGMICGFGYIAYNKIK